MLEPTDIFNEWGDVGNFYDGRQEGQIIYSNTYGGFKGKLSYQTNDDKAVKVSGHQRNCCLWSECKA
ncbi:hypothetical protein Ri1_14470 [Aeromonas dhakensis]|nr:hypothetical protein Ri1_14470 [Aeromonas dhakensis]